MNSLWKMISFFSVVHMLALLIFLGWLGSSGRLNIDRVQDLKELFALTIAETEALEAQQASEDQSDQNLDDQRMQMGSSEQLSMLTLLQKQERQASRRMKDSSEMLSLEFAKLNQETTLEREKFEAERKSWEEDIRDDWERKNDEQFSQTVKQYEMLPAKQGKRLLIDLIAGGGREQAVAYLDAMNPRAANKIFKEFKTPEEITLAKELLEELRTFGLGTLGSQDSGNDNSADDNKGNDA